MRVPSPLDQVKLEYCSCLATFRSLLKAFCSNARSTIPTPIEVIAKLVCGSLVTNKHILIIRADNIDMVINVRTIIEGGSRYFEYRIL